MSAQSSGENPDFRGMLVRLSNLLKKDDLVAMKYMCKDIIGKRDLSKIESFFELCDNLESRDFLGGNNVIFLQKLLSGCCSGRKDVLHVLESYNKTRNNISNGTASNNTQNVQFVPANVNPQQIVYMAPMPVPGFSSHQVSPSSASYSSPTYGYKHIEKEINYLTRKLGREWRFFMRTLGISDYDMAEMEQQHPRNMREQIHGCFVIWVQQNKGAVHKKMLTKALMDVSVERFDLCANLEENDFS
ncbi:fas-associated death domain protein-like [Mizuhopecten yessoensis]|uniref:Death domain-containing adapter protein BG4 n=1 Tax=Mizuhopecten yessoensis TaxID=6573 RepID=A0A210R5A4_MIZYE|nr:fas-associated death domain protein-like [Mizuhopecten yessoensis]OWF56212.1 Death domain-containing adapter protein BG4 [Mizuhopecten yessoensis]